MYLSSTKWCGINMLAAQIKHKVNKDNQAYTTHTIFCLKYVFTFTLNVLKWNLHAQLYVFFHILISWNCVTFGIADSFFLCDSCDCQSASRQTAEMTDDASTWPLAIRSNCQTASLASPPQVFSHIYLQAYSTRPCHLLTLSLSCLLRENSHTT